jgi:hypothetical protein
VAAMGDLNGDGRPDLAVGSRRPVEDGEERYVGILVNDGTGAFAPAPMALDFDYTGVTDTGAPRELIAIAIGDVNGDGRADLVMAIGAGTGVAVLLSLGNGAFAAASYNAATAGEEIISIALGDIDGDGKPDLATTTTPGLSLRCETNVKIFKNDGNGGFVSPAAYGAGTGAFSLALGDLNGDGALDLVTANKRDGTASVLLNDGRGTLAAAVDYPAGVAPSAIAVGDLNGDGKADLAVANNLSNDVSVLLNDGHGAFLSAGRYPAGAFPTSVAVGDIDGDGASDLAITSDLATGVGVLLNGGGGTFTAPVRYGLVSLYPKVVGVRDLNADGKADVVVVGYRGLNVLLNNSR